MQKRISNNPNGITKIKEFLSGEIVTVATANYQKRCVLKKRILIFTVLLFFGGFVSSCENKIIDFTS